MDEKRQIVVAAALIRNDEGKFLFQRRVDPLITAADGKWEIPGGKVDWGENPKETAKREAKEETGCTIHIRRLLPFVHSNIYIRTDGKSQHVLVLCFEADFTGGTPMPIDKKVSEVGWFTKDEAKKLDMLTGIWDFISLVEK